MKQINTVVETCSGCPYNHYEEYEDVGTSYGMDYYCRKIDGGGATTGEFVAGNIREECPLKDVV